MSKPFSDHRDRERALMAREDVPGSRLLPGRARLTSGASRRDARGDRRRT